MKKNNIISLVCSLVVLGLIVFAVYPTTSASSSSKKEEKETTTGTYADGVYEGEADGFGGTVSAKVTVEGGKITAVELTGDAETPTVGGAALEELTDQIIAANGAEIDGVSGATFTSNGVKDAVTAALANAASSSAGDSSSALADGTYEGEADGFGGKITATVTVEGGKITAVELTGDDETPTVGGAALEELTDQVIEANGAKIDGVSGATFTSDGVKDAVTDALD